VAWQVPRQFDSLASGSLQLGLYQQAFCWQHHDSDQSLSITLALAVVPGFVQWLAQPVKQMVNSKPMMVLI